MTYINPFSNMFTSVSDTLSKMGHAISTEAKSLSNDISTIFGGGNNAINTEDIFASSNSINRGITANSVVFVGNKPENIIGKSEALAAEGLKRVSTKQLQELGRKSDKTEFFKALLPAALEAEKRYGVPASVTLAQAALESGWAKASIGGYNIFGIKGKGPAGTVPTRTREYENGKYVTITANFAKYNNFYEAVMSHGKVFQAGYKGYQKGLDVYAKTGNDYAFIKAVGSTYATSPTYVKDIQQIMKDYDLVKMAKTSYVI